MLLTICFFVVLIGCYGFSKDHVKSSSESKTLRGTFPVSAQGESDKDYIRDESHVEDDSYTELDVRQYKHQKKQALNWILSQGKEEYDWGDDTQRAIIALRLAKDPFDANTQDEVLMFNKMHVKLAIALARNQTKIIPLSDLSLYINALQATCSDPRNFHGFDLVSTLRKRVDAAHYSGQNVMPSVYLTLCLNNYTNFHDVQKLHDVFSSRDIFADKIDVQALALMATSCVIQLSQAENSRASTNLRSRLVQSIETNGLPGNIYEVALIVQALNEARADPNAWNREKAMHFLLQQQNENGSFGDILATYYVLPILSNKSLLSLTKCCEKSTSNGLKPIEVLKNTKQKRMYVNYALYYGSPVKMSQTMMLSVPEGSNFFDVMRLAQDTSSNYRFTLDDQKTIPCVYSIGGIPNDAERGIYWILHVKRHPNVTTLDYRNLEPYMGNIKQLQPKFGEEFVFWLKSL